MSANIGFHLIIAVCKFIVFSCSSTTTTSGTEDSFCDCGSKARSPRRNNAQTSQSRHAGKYILCWIVLEFHATRTLISHKLSYFFQHQEPTRRISQSGPQTQPQPRSGPPPAVSTSRSAEQGRLRSQTSIDRETERQREEERRREDERRRREERR